MLMKRAKKVNSVNIVLYFPCLSKLSTWTYCFENVKCNHFECRIQTQITQLEPVCCGLIVKKYFTFPENNLSSCIYLVFVNSCQAFRCVVRVSRGVFAIFYRYEKTKIMQIWWPLFNIYIYLLTNVFQPIVWHVKQLTVLNCEQYEWNLHKFENRFWNNTGQEKCGTNGRRAIKPTTIAKQPAFKWRRIKICFFLFVRLFCTNIHI